MTSLVKHQGARIVSVLLGFYGMKPVFAFTAFTPLNNGAYRSEIAACDPRASQW